MLALIAENERLLALNCEDAYEAARTVRERINRTIPKTVRGAVALLELVADHIDEDAEPEFSNALAGLRRIAEGGR